MKSITTDKIEKVLAFFLGLIVCNNVIYVFKVGRTYINVSLVYGIIVFAFLVIVKKQSIKKGIIEMSTYLKAFIIVAVISVVVAIIVFHTELSLLSSYFNGIIELMLCMILYIDTVLLKENKREILKGLAVGFFMNIVLSLVQYITYNNGNYFSLYKFFPQPAFQINSHFGANTALQNSSGIFNIYGYRAQGIFLETSYYMAFIAGTAIVLMTTTKNNILKVISILSMIFIIALTSSGNMIIIVFTFVFYYIMKKMKSNNSIEKKMNIEKVTYISFIICSICIVGILNISKIQNIIETNNVGEKIMKNISSANIADKGNSGRFTSMIKSLALIPKYPLGVGYNMSPTLLSKEYESGILEKNTTFNRLITIQLEQGFFGTIFYIMFIWQISITLILKSHKKYTLALGIAVLGIFICQIGNGIGFFPFIVLIFALANIEYNEIRSGTINIEEGEK